ncbi:chromo domain-containing protein [Trichonephila clavipes]|nr:chromo domain-containing protein [Trichonephila clavipes]
MDKLERYAKTLKSRQFTRITKNSASKLDMERLKKLYYDPREPGSFGGVKRLTEASGYPPGWTEETLTIYKRYPTNPPTYVLQDLSGKEIAGRFYAEELQKINKTSNDFWAIEKIIHTKGRGSSRQLLVKWVGLDDSFNSWIKAEWLKT